MKRNSRCTGCGVRKPDSEFYRYKNGKKRPRCKTCMYTSGRVSQKRWEAVNREHLREYRRDWNRKRNAQLKRELVDAYGGACTCCGEREIAFLSCDHVYGRTTEDDRMGANLWGYVKRLGFPDAYTVLCHNCNQGRQINGGVCPHINNINNTTGDSGR